jgi:hypothetical protein
MYSRRPVRVTLCLSTFGHDVRISRQRMLGQEMGSIAAASRRRKWTIHRQYTEPAPGRGAGFGEPLLGLCRAFSRRLGRKALARVRHGLCLGLDDVENAAKVEGGGLQEVGALGKRNFLVHNVSGELAGKSTCLAAARAWLPARQPARRAVKGLPLDGETRLPIQ